MMLLLMKKAVICGQPFLFFDKIRMSVSRKAL